MSIDQATELEKKLIQRAVARLRAGVVAIAFGMVAGTGLFVATIWLVVRGGLAVGAHLGLLSNYFPGYSVTWFGAIMGFVYGALVGAVVGWVIGWVYNWMVEVRFPTSTSDSDSR